MTTIWIYVDTRKEVGDADHLKVFANADAAETWFEENDPEGVAFEYEVLARLRLRPTRRVAVVAPIAGSLTSSGKTSLKDR